MQAELATGPARKRLQWQQTLCARSMREATSVSACEISHLRGQAGAGARESVNSFNKHHEASGARRRGLAANKSRVPTLTARQN